MYRLIVALEIRVDTNDKSLAQPVALAAVERACEAERLRQKDGLETPFEFVRADVLNAVEM